jgi:cytochrome b
MRKLAALELIMVWDWPTRLGHWGMALAFALAYVTAESERWRLVHVISGSTVLAIASFRVLWGFVGSRYARFAEFMEGPRAVVFYISTLINRMPGHYIGHNPAGGWSVILLLACVFITTVTGFMAYQEMKPAWIGRAHEWASNATLIVIGIHLAGVITSSILHKENLVKAMITGRKYGVFGRGIGPHRSYVLWGMLAWIAIVVYWVI